MNKRLKTAFAAAGISCTLLFTAAAAQAALPPQTHAIEQTIHPIEAKAKCSRSCQQAIGRLLRAWNRYTDPAKCNVTTFMPGVSRESCVSTQKAWRWGGYGVIGGVAGMIGLANALLKRRP